MISDAHHIISETNEDRLDETDSLEEAVRIARSLASEGQAGDPVSIEHRGKVIRQLVLMPHGRVEEEVLVRRTGAGQGVARALPGESTRSGNKATGAAKR